MQQLRRINTELKSIALRNEIVSDAQYSLIFTHSASCTVCADCFCQYWQALLDLLLTLGLAFSPQKCKISKWACCKIVLNFDANEMK